MQIPLETPLRQPLNIFEPKTSVFTVLENINEEQGICKINFSRKNWIFRAIENFRNLFEMIKICKNGYF